MPPLFDPRRMYRTPGFAPDGLYDDEQEPLPPLPDRIVPQDQQQSNMGLSGMIAAAPAQIDPVRELPQERPQTDMMRPPQRQRITLPSAPLPPKVGKMRQVLGHAAAVFLPQVGTEIVAPGHTRAYREWEQNNRRLMSEAEINAKAAEEESRITASMANMARADASRAQRQRTVGQMEGDNYRNIAPNASVADLRTGRTIATNHLPPKPETPGMRITVDEAKRRGLYVSPGAENVELPAGGASAYLNTLPRADRSYDTLKQAIRDANPDWDQSDVDAEASTQYKAQRKLAEEKTKADTARANRPYPGKNTNRTPNQEDNRNKALVDDQAKVAIADAGGIDEAIAAATDEKVITRLKSMKGGSLIRGNPNSGGSGYLSGLTKKKPPVTPSPNQNPSGTVTVTDPTGGVHTFKDQAAANAFKREAGIK